tara:strand:- start:317 stop:502 length:186 start_codon:yes stop_codon:yes gene_type:complete
MNKNYLQHLNTMIKLSGVKRKFIANKLDISESMLSLQLKGERAFKNNQYNDLLKLLEKYLA